MRTRGLRPYEAVPEGEWRFEERAGKQVGNTVAHNSQQHDSLRKASSKGGLLVCTTLKIRLPLLSPSSFWLYKIIVSVLVSPIQIGLFFGFGVEVGVTVKDVRDTWGGGGEGRERQERVVHPFKALEGKRRRERTEPNDHRTLTMFINGFLYAKTRKQSGQSQSAAEVELS